MRALTASEINSNGKSLKPLFSVTILLFCGLANIGLLYLVEAMSTLD